MFKRILLPIDLAEPEMARQALDEAVALAKSSDGQLRLVNVQSLVPLSFSEFGSPDYEGEIRLAAQKQIAEIAAKIDYPHEHVSTTVRIGAVYDGALTEASEWVADLIVICSQRPTMATYLLGSNAGNIVRHAKCSVLVVRHLALVPR